MLSKYFQLWQAVCWWFRNFMRHLLFQTIHDLALMMDRERNEREASPRTGIVDSPSVQAPHAEVGAGKKIVRHKRHIVVDTDDRLLMVNLTPADISDSAGVQFLLDAIRKRWPWLKHLFADNAYDRTRLMGKAAYLDFVVEIVRRVDEEPGFKLLPRRWVVERTFGWMIRWRRLYERRFDVSKAMIHIATRAIPLRRVAHRVPFSNGLYEVGGNGPQDT